MQSTASRPIRLTVGANFVADPIRESLEYWFGARKMPAAIEFLPQDQLIQQLLDPSRLLASSPDYFLVLLQLERWIPDGPDSRGAPLRNYKDFTDALGIAALRASTQFIVIVCPSLPERRETEALRTIESALKDGMRELPGVDWVGTAEMEYLFPTARDASTFDRYLGRIAQIPYTRMGFAIIGTMAARHLHRFVTPPRKAIVVDCDNTLWSGLCGETAVADLRVGSGRRALQEFLIRQQEAGRLLLIASKNDEANVFAVFDRHPEMLLKREHLTAWRIDWNEKPRNVRDLANELGLGLDSFILIDDDRFECEAMRSAWPEVLTLRLPEDENETGAFLRGVWEFDFRPPTTDDRRRRDYYVQNVERNRRRRGMSLADFVKTLELRLDIAPLAPDGLARAAQLTERINQFNLNGIRRSEGELRLRLADAGQISLLLKAQDRFGDYGDIGLILASVRSRSLLLETLVLSCRALGKGIEESIASRLAQLADDVGASRIEFLHRATDRNGPFRNFLSEIGVTAVGDQWTVSPDVIRRRAVESSAPVAS